MFTAGTSITLRPKLLDTTTEFELKGSAFFSFGPYSADGKD